jgi:hypothetical protein
MQNVSVPDSSPRCNLWDSLTDGFKALLKSAAAKLKGSARRQFLAQTVRELGPGGQSLAERELGWNRETIRKGMHELTANMECKDGFSLRGRKSSEKHLPDLANDIRDIVEPNTQVDATLRTSRLYIKMTARRVRTLLIEQKNYKDEDLPKRRTISTILNELGYHLRKVKKNKPLKKIPETDAIFEQLRKVNREADEAEGTLRISMDAKASVKLGSFSRGGLSRVDVEAGDHDFGDKGSLTPFGILLPQHDDLFISFAESKITSDYMWDRIEAYWAGWEAKHHPSTLQINQDNGPENSSRRTQFIKRAVEFANQHGITIKLAYYPPYHSKYNPVERTHGALEQYWNGMLLTDAQTTIKIAENMTWKGKHPVVTLVTQIYEKGVKLTKKGMAAYEKMINRMTGLEDYFVEIRPAPA